MPREVLLIRHGQSEFNAAMAATGVDPNLPDARLSKLGHSQVAERRRDVDPLPIDLVVTSPFTRAIQTAFGLFEHRDLPMQVEPLVREVVGASCDIGRHPATLAADFPSLDFDHLPHPWWHAPNGDPTELSIEPDHVVADRVARFRSWLAEREEPAIAVVGHSAFFYAMTGCSLANCEIFRMTI